MSRADLKRLQGVLDSIPAEVAESGPVVSRLDPGRPIDTPSASTGAVTRLLDDHRAGRRQAGDALWALLNLELWHRTFIDGGGVQTLPLPDRRDAAHEPTAALQHA